MPPARLVLALMLLLAAWTEVPAAGSSAGTQTAPDGAAAADADAGGDCGPNELKVEDLCVIHAPHDSITYHLQVGLALRCAGRARAGGWGAAAAAPAAASACASAAPPAADVHAPLLRRVLRLARHAVRVRRVHPHQRGGQVSWGREGAPPARAWGADPAGPRAAHGGACPPRCAGWAWACCWPWGAWR